MRPASHLAKDRVGAEGNGNGVGHQQKGQQQLEGRMSKQLLDIHLSDELLHIPGVLEGEGDLPSGRRHHGWPLPGLFKSSGERGVRGGVPQPKRVMLSEFMACWFLYGSHNLNGH